MKLCNGKLKLYDGKNPEVVSLSNYIILKIFGRFAAGIVKGVVPILQVKEAENANFGDIFERTVLCNRGTKLVQIFFPVDC